MFDLFIWKISLTLVQNQLIMKQLYILFTLLFFSYGSINAQTVDIPDVNFKNALLNYDNYGAPIDLNNDDEIQVSEAEQLTILSLPNQNISNLTGIEAFSNILELDVSNNLLTSLDFSNSSLESLICNNNQLENINTTNLPALYELRAANNSISSIDVSQNSSLAMLDIGNNPIPTLDFSDNFLYSVNLENTLITDLDLSDSWNLNELYISNCANLEQVNLKNIQILGDGICFVVAENCPNIHSICIDNVNNPTITDSPDIDPQINFTENCDNLSTGNTKEIKNLVQIYPNPVNDFINIKTDENIQLKNLKLYNLQGQELLQFPQSIKRINLSQLSAGMYILKVETNQGSANQQIIKQ